LPPAADEATGKPFEGPGGWAAVRAWVVLPLALLLAGCCSAPFSPLDVAADAPAEGGDGDRAVRVFVVDDDGPAPSSLVAWWLRDEAAVESGGKLVLETLGLRSEGGRFVAHVPLDRTVHLAAASDESHTQEWLLEAFPARDAKPDEVTLRVFRTEMDGVIEGTWGPADVNLRPVFGVTWKPSPIEFSPDRAVNEGYHARLVQLSGNLTWTNTATETASLGVVIANETSPPGSACSYQDTGHEVAPGPQREPFSVPFADRCWPATHSQEPGDPPLLIGPATDTHVVAPLKPLAYRIDYHARFQERATLDELCARFDGRDVQVVEVDPVTGDRHAPRAAGSGPSPERTSPLPTGLALGAGLVALAGLMRRKA
jgi:hypothetical protein